MGGPGASIPTDLDHDADRHACADRIPADGGLLLQGCDYRKCICGHGSAATMAFWMLVIAACFTSFYSWRLIFMTFHGKPRASRDVMNHVHESPLVMLVPLFLLALGALFAGLLFKEYFIGHDEALFWRNALYSCRKTPSSPRCTMCRVGSCGHRSLHGDRVCGVVAVLYSQSGLPGSWRRNMSRSTSSCSTSGTLTSCMTSSSFVLQCGLAASCGRRVTAG